MMWRYRGACHTESVLCHCMYESQELYRRVYRVIVCMSCTVQACVSCHCMYELYCTGVCIVSLYV